MVIGVVGGIGSGKSVVTDTLVARGGYRIDADELGHEALRQPDILARIARRFGTEVLDEHGQVDRRKLGRRVFEHAEELMALEALVFPHIEGRIREEIERGRQAPFVVLDAAIMLEKGWARVCDKIVFVDAPRALRLERLRQQRGWSEADVARRERAQMSVEEKRRHADAVVVNEAGPLELARQVEELLRTWQAGSC